LIIAQKPTFVPKVCGFSDRKLDRGFLPSYTNKLTYCNERDCKPKARKTALTFAKPELRQKKGIFYTRQPIK
jgi:hypothetical protein